MYKTSKGMTLLETVVASAVLSILIVSITSVLSYTFRSSTDISPTHNEFENARIAMDGLLTNLQMAESINLRVNDDHVLRNLTLTQRDPEGHSRNYFFDYYINANENEPRYQRLEFGGNEFASSIASIKVQRVTKDRMQITVISGGEKPVSLSGSVDIRYKNVSITIMP